MATSTTTSEPTTRRGEAQKPAEPDAPRQRARRGVLAAGVALVALAIAAGAWWGTRTGGEVIPVLALTGPVEAGQTLTRDVLRAAEMTTGEDLETIPVGEVDAYVGLIATGNLPAGTILTPGMLAEFTVVEDGQAMVGIPIAPGQVPAGGVRPGDKINLVMGVSGSRAPTTGGGAATTEDGEPAPPVQGLTDPGRTWEATVVNVGTIVATDGTITIDISIGSGEQARTLAAAASSRNLSIVLLPAGDED